MGLKHRLTRLGRALRTWLCVLAVFGLLPGSGELVENLAHLVHDGHLAHSETHTITASEEVCGDDAEHGCTPFAHHCGCCMSVVGAPARPGPRLPARRVGDRLRRPGGARSPPGPAVEPPFFPPIHVLEAC